MARATFKQWFNPITDELFVGDNPTEPAPWWIRWLCIFSHAWRTYKGPKRVTGKVVMSPAFMPEYEIEGTFICTRCLRTKIVDGFCATKLLKLCIDHPWIYDDQGWPIDADGKRLPSSKNWNATGW